MSKHTPGPWVAYDDSNDGKTNRVEIVAKGKTVARIYHSVPDEDLSNARLIAAVPELLEALNNLSWYADMCVSFLKETHPGKSQSLNERVKKAAEAIAKATGEQQ